MDKPRKYSSTALKNVLNNIDEKEQARIESRMALSVCIAMRLKQLGISKLKFSQLLHVQPSMVTRWLSGSHNFTHDTLFDIQRELGFVLFNTAEPKLEHSKSFIGKDYAVFPLQRNHKVTDSDEQAVFQLPVKNGQYAFFVSGSHLIYHYGENSNSNFKPCSTTKSALLYR